MSRDQYVGALGVKDRIRVHATGGRGEKSDPGQEFKRYTHLRFRRQGGRGRSRRGSAGKAVVIAATEGRSSPQKHAGRGVGEGKGVVGTNCVIMLCFVGINFSKYFEGDVYVCNIQSRPLSFDLTM
jgi:hypothetical protein